ALGGQAVLGVAALDLGDEAADVGRLGEVLETPALALARRVEATLGGARLARSFGVARVGPAVERAQPGDHGLGLLDSRGRLRRSTVRARREPDPRSAEVSAPARRRAVW